MLKNQMQNAKTAQNGWAKRLSSWGLVAEAAIATTVVSIFVSTNSGLLGGAQISRPGMAQAQPKAANTQLIAIHLPVGTNAAKQNDPRKTLKRGMNTLEQDLSTVVHNLSKGLKQP